MKEEQIAVCKNCNHSFTGNFCNNCGQAADTSLIGFKFILKQLHKTFIHFDSGFFYTLKELFVSPGHTLKAYIEGKRIKHMNPFSFVFIIAGVYSFLFHYFHIDIFVSTNKNDDNEVFRNFISQHYASVQLAIIPVLSLVTLLMFPKKEYRFFEILIVNTYLTGQRIAIGILLLPIIYVYRNEPIKETYISMAAYIVSITIFFLAYRLLFKQRSTWRVLWASISTNIVTLFVLVFIVYYLQAFIQ